MILKGLGTLTIAGVRRRQARVIQMRLGPKYGRVNVEVQHIGEMRNDYTIATPGMVLAVKGSGGDFDRTTARRDRQLQHGNADQISGGQTNSLVGGDQTNNDNPNPTTTRKRRPRTPTTTSTPASRTSSPATTPTTATAATIPSNSQGVQRRQPVQQHRDPERRAEQPAGRRRGQRRQRRRRPAPALPGLIAGPHPCSTHRRPAEAGGGFCL